jgi:hypothetical protein
MSSFPIITSLANQCFDYYQTDSLDRYTPILKNGLPNDFKHGDVKYQFNSNGFRCDEFNTPSDLPIVFLGCSYTEGVGLPIEKTWGYLLTEKIRIHTNKQIPFWSLAQGGKGIDNQVRLLSSFVQDHPTKFIFVLLPPPGRREFCFESNTFQYWIPNPTIHVNHLKDVTGKLFSDPYYIENEDRKSFLILDLIRKNQQAQVITSSWGCYPTPPIFNEFPEIKYIQWKIVTSPDFARDNQHPGVKYHRALAEYFWLHNKHLF